MIFARRIDHVFAESQFQQWALRSGVRFLVHFDPAEMRRWKNRSRFLNFSDEMFARGARVTHGTK